MIMTREKGQRMWGGGGAVFGGSGGVGGAGGGGGADGVSIPYYNQNFELLYKQMVTDGTTGVVSTTFMTAQPNEIVNTGTETDSESGDVTVTSLVGPRAKNAMVIGDAMLVWDAVNNAIKVVGRDGSTAANFYATGGVSALGYGPGGGGGGATALTDLVDVAVSSPTNGQVLMYNSSTGKWYNGTVNISDMATKTWVTGQIEGSQSVVEDWVEDQGYITSSAISDMATKTWVGQQGFLTSSAISDMATKTWVNNQGFLTSSSISDMATKTWVNNQGFLTSSSNVAFSQLPTMYWADVQVKSSIDSNTSPQFGNVRVKPGDNNYGGHLYFGDGSYVYLHEDSDDHLQIYGDKGVSIAFGSGYGLTVSGDVTAGKVKLSDHLIMHSGYTGIYINSTGTEIDWHNAQNAFVATLMTFSSSMVTANQGLTIPSGKKLSIGGFEVEYDSVNQALKFNGSIYATGGVSALGVGSGGGSIQDLTMTGTLTFRVNGMDSTIYADNDGGLHIDGSEWIVMGNDLDMDGYTLYGTVNAGDGSVTAKRFYVGSGRYIYLDGTTLKYNDNGTVKTIVLS